MSLPFVRMDLTHECRWIFPMSVDEPSKTADGPSTTADWSSMGVHGSSRLQMGLPRRRMDRPTSADESSNKCGWIFPMSADGSSIIADGSFLSACCIALRSPSRLAARQT